MFKTIVLALDGSALRFIQARPSLRCRRLPSAVRICPSGLTPLRGFLQ